MPCRIAGADDVRRLLFQFAGRRRQSDIRVTLNQSTVHIRISSAFLMRPGERGDQTVDLVKILDPLRDDPRVAAGESEFDAPQVLLAAAGLDGHPVIYAPVCIPL